jgi:hypothetical protein
MDRALLVSAILIQALQDLKYSFGSNVGAVPKASVGDQFVHSS